MKIFCIGRNYVDHALELNNPIPKSPIIFMKPPTAILAEGKPFYHPEFSKNIHFELELVLKIKKNGKSIQPEFASSYYDQVALGIDFTARDLQDTCKEKGHPWEIAKAFDHSAVIGPFFSIDEVKSADGSIHFELLKNGQTVQSGSSDQMIFDFDSLIVHISKYFTLQQGDLIYTGTPAGVGKIEIGDKLVGKIAEREGLHCEIK